MSHHIDSGYEAREGSHKKSQRIGQMVKIRINPKGTGADAKIMWAGTKSLSPTPRSSEHLRMSFSTSIRWTARRRTWVSGEVYGFHGARRKTSNFYTQIHTREKFKFSGFLEYYG